MGEGNAYPGDPPHGKLPPMRVLLVLAAVLGACGDNIEVAPDGGLPDDFLDRLRALPGVHDAREYPTLTEGFHYFVLHFEQPVDHDDPQSPTFLQEVSLLHRELSRPMVVFTSGYWDYYLDREVELTSLLDGNQVSIEHRYFGTSRPDPADWSKLTIAQMAADQHRIVTSLRTLYGGKFLTAGGSKGGMTAIYYRRFYPDDVDGTVPYVAPISFGAPDTRYVPFLDTLGPMACRQAVRDVATEMLANRRAAMTTRAQDQATMQGHQYTRIALAPAVESSIFSLEWAFWQYFGVGSCSRVPATTASDDAMFDFLDDISPVSDNADARIGQFDAYYYQAYHQLGYPDGGAAYLDPYVMFTDADYLNALPTTQPAYDGGTAMTDVDAFVKQDGSRFLFIYGQWDPWTGGQFELGNAADSLRLVQAQGTHGARISRLADADRDAAFAKLEAWTGVTPTLPPQPRTTLDVPVPRVPPGFIRALRARRLSP
jgi:hypothetical protein